MNKVYLMKDGPTGFYKIGKSIDPVRRERTLLAQQPYIDLWCYWEDEGDQHERILHRTFADLRRRGEWFELSMKEIWRLYWLMRHSRRIDIHEDAKTWAIEYRKREWRFTSLMWSNRRYIHLRLQQDNTGLYVAPETYHASMEWHNDGNTEQVTRQVSKHPNDIPWLPCVDSFDDIPQAEWE